MIFHSLLNDVIFNILLIFLKTINLDNSSNFTTPMKSSKHPTHATMSTPKNTRVKRKQTSIFMPFIKATNKHSKILVKAMEHINTSQLDIDKTHIKSQKKTFKHYFKYLKERRLTK
jgi:hypothetical protein